MATLHVRNVPDELYERLGHEAASSRRSINAEAIEVLRRGLRGSGALSLDDVLARARARRRSTELSTVSAAELIREDRGR
ncbi:MAG: FitA-like ribbon-helix-helix domain-containing protein [Solirubrobacterales bacterium]